MSQFRKAIVYYKSGNEREFEREVNIAALYSHLLDHGYTGNVELITYWDNDPDYVWFMKMENVRNIRFYYYR